MHELGGFEVRGDRGDIGVLAAFTRRRLAAEHAKPEHELRDFAAVTREVLDAARALGLEVRHPPAEVRSGG